MGFVITTPRVIEFAREQYQIAVRDLLDDPSWLLHPEFSRAEAAQLLGEIRQIGRDLSMDFDQIAAAEGSEFEVKRLSEIERQVAAR